MTVFIPTSEVSLASLWYPQTLTEKSGDRAYIERTLLAYTRDRIQSNLVVTMDSVQGVFNRYIDVIVITDEDLSGHVRSRS